MNIRVEVKSTQLDRVRVYQGRNYGEQGAAVYNGGDFPLPIKVNVEVGHEYAPGVYAIDPRSFRADEFGNLKIKALRLLPLGGSSADTPAAPKKA